MIDLYNGDCLDVMKYIPDNSIDLVLTDPPYGTTACKWDSIIPFEPMWKELNRIIKDNSAIILFGSEPFSSALRMSNIKQFKYDWIWEKSKASNIFQAKYMPLKSHEIISVFCKGEKYNKGIEKRNVIDVYGKMSGGNKIINKDGYRFPRSVQYFRTTESEGKFHPTLKPVAKNRIDNHKVESKE